MDDQRIRELTDEVLSQIGAGGGSAPAGLEARVAALEATVARLELGATRPAAGAARIRPLRHGAGQAVRPQRRVPGARALDRL
ncbi:MAG: hypothetical protein DMF82_21070 [Acidobacteria bacterium]|nr:MAG: hypothetical protein DMF82_21070 [Acidobacteriota bacterium]